MLGKAKSNDVDAMMQAVAIAQKRIGTAAAARRELMAAKAVDVRPTAESCIRVLRGWAGKSPEHCAATRRELETAPHRFVKAVKMRDKAVKELAEKRLYFAETLKVRHAYLAGDQEGLADVKTELAEIGSNVFELLSIAFEVAAECTPAVFGTAGAEEVGEERDRPKRAHDVAVGAAQEIPGALLFGIARVAGVALDPERDLVERLIAHAVSGR